MPIVGVMPEGFDDVTTPGAQIWRVLGYAVTDPYGCRTCRHLRMIARLKPGVTVERAQSELTKVHKALVVEHPADYGSPDALVAPLQKEVTLPYRPALLALGVAVALMLVIAIANMTNLQLARIVRRGEEFAIRTALGASAPRLARRAHLYRYG